MSISTPHKVLLGFITASLLLFGMMGLFINLLYRSVEGQRLVAHTYTVLSSLEGINGGLNSAESAQRAFFITGDQRYFAGRDDAMSKVESLIIDLRELTADDQRQQARLPGLARLVQAKLETMNDMFATRPEARTEAARRKVAEDAAATASILAAVTEMQSEEQRFLAKRRAAEDSDAVLIPWMLASVSFMLLVTLSMLFSRIHREIRERERVQDRLRLIASTDELTGVHNRHSFMALGGQAVAVAQRYSRPLTCVMLDADHFKRINDGHGHEAGDTVLKVLADTMLRELREVDIIGRIGGEEFAILLPETELDRSLDVADRLRAVLASTQAAIAGGSLDFTVSLGVAQLGSDMDLTGVLAAADRGLYAAKHGGRNRVSVAP